MKTVPDLEEAVRPLDAVLRPLVQTPAVDLGSAARSRRPHRRTGESYVWPVDRAGVRREMERLVAEIIECYVAATEADRDAIRTTFRTYDSFRWAAALPQGPIDVERLRDSLSLFSIEDQGLDWRDAIVWLDHLCVSANPMWPRLVSIRRFRVRASSRHSLLRALTIQQGSFGVAW